jgi:hypothetical protein
MRFKKIKKAEKIEKMVCVSSPDKKEMVCSPGGEIKKVEAREPAQGEEKRGNILIGTLNFFAAPHQALKGNYEKRYSAAKKLFILDLILLGIVGALIGLNVYLFLSRATYDFGFLKFKPEGGIFKNGETPGASSVLLTDIKINGQEKLIVNPGEDLEYTLSYRNDSNESIFDVAMRVNLEGAILDFEQLDLGVGARRNWAVIWTKDQVPEFRELPAGANGDLKFKIGASEIAEPAKVLKFGSVLKSWVDLSYKLKSGFGEAVSSGGEVLENQINSDLAVQVLARYFSPEGDQLGRGPLPPEVGVETKYWVFWSVENNLNDVSDVSVTAHLPQGVEWTENVSVALGNLSYNPSRRAILWEIGDLDRFTGEEWPRQGVAFEISLEPTSGQVGQPAVLLDQIKIFGSDKFTEQFLEKISPVLTTDLIYDKLAQDKGRVIK